VTDPVRKATRLRKLRLTRVDTVTAGANVDPLTGEGAKILLYKSAESAATTNGGAPMPTTEDEQLAVLAKAVEDATGAAVAEVKTELDELRKQYDDEKTAFEAAVKAAADAEALEDPEKIDKAALPEAVRKRLEALEAQDAVNRQAIEKMADRAETAKWADVAKGLPLVAVAKSVGGNAQADLTELLKRIAKDSGAEVAEQVAEVLGQADEKLKQSALLGEAGAGNGEGQLSDADAALEKAADKLITEALAKGETLSRPAAITKAVNSDPVLARRLMEASNA
jgi:hypothetical protein